MKEYHAIVWRVHNFEHKKLLIKNVPYLGSLDTKFEQKYNGSLDQVNFAHTLLLTSDQNVYWTWAGITLWPFSCISKMMVQIKYKITLFLCIIFCICMLCCEFEHELCPYLRLLFFVWCTQWLIKTCSVGLCPHCGFTDVFNTSYLDTLFKYLWNAYCYIW